MSKEEGKLTAAAILFCVKDDFREAATNNTDEGIPLQLPPPLTELLLGMAGGGEDDAQQFGSAEEDDEEELPASLSDEEEEEPRRGCLRFFVEKRRVRTEQLGAGGTGVFHRKNAASKGSIFAQFKGFVVGLCARRVENQDAEGVARPSVVA